MVLYLGRGTDTSGKPSETRGEYANCTQKNPRTRMELNSGPSYCKAIMLTNVLLQTAYSKKKLASEIYSKSKVKALWRTLLAAIFVQS